MEEDLICHMEYTVPECSSLQLSWWSIISMPSSPVFLDKFISKRPHRQSNAPLFVTVRKLKRRRLNENDPVVPKTRSVQTIGPLEISLCLPTTLQDVQQRVVNAMAGILPVESKINVFGFWHSVILVGCFYRHENLCWILLNRLNHRLYITSHFSADSLHLFNELRPVMQLADKQRGKKWTRQGVNDALCIFHSSVAMQQSHSTKLNTLPRGVLKFTNTNTAMAESIAFLKGTGRAGKTLERFTRIAAPPTGFSAITSTVTETTCGWKVFRTSGANGCKGNATKPCTCSHFVQALKTQGFSNLSPIEAAGRLMTVLPSSLDKPSCAPLYSHYQPFIQHVKANPSILYFPQGDVLII